MKLCTVPGCTRKHKAEGLCGTHHMRAWRMQQRTLLIRGLLKYEGKARLLAKDVPWLQKLLRDVQIAQETHRLAEIGRRLEAQQKSILTKNNALADRVAELEREKHIRERNRDRRRERRQAGIILPSDPAGIRDHYAPGLGLDTRKNTPNLEPTFSRFFEPTKASPFVQPTSENVHKEPIKGEPIAPASRPPRLTPIGQKSDKVTPADGQDWLKYVGIPRVPVAPARSATPAPAGNKSAALLEKIARAGYQTKNGRVLYNNDRWIAPEEWVKLMPGILD